MANGGGVEGPGALSQQHGPTYSPSLIMDRCAGCNAANVSLLACDDLEGASGNSKDGVPPVGDPSKQLRYVEMIEMIAAFTAYQLAITRRCCAMDCLPGKIL